MNGMKEKSDKGKPNPKLEEREEKKELPGYPEYPPNEDIYDKSKEEESIDPEDISKTKELTEKSKRGKKNEKDFDWFQKNNPQALAAMEIAEPERFNKLFEAYNAQFV